MKTLYVLYDSHCGLCTEVRDWLQAQPAYLDLQVMASDSDDARRMFPSLPAGQLAVVSDQGQVWLGDRAFIICLWALREFRGWARRLASPLLRPMARHAFSAVSQNRQSVSNILGLKSEAELKKRLKEVTLPSCPIK
jgi:predicted DCC family thiol-disulfide oxidoreductase YuxK